MHSLNLPLAHPVKTLPKYETLNSGSGVLISMLCVRLHHSLPRPLEMVRIALELRSPLRLSWKFSKAIKCRSKVSAPDLSSLFDLISVDVAAVGDVGCVLLAISPSSLA